MKRIITTLLTIVMLLTATQSIYAEDIPATVDFYSIDADEYCRFLKHINLPKNCTKLQGGNLYESVPVRCLCCKK